MGGLLLPQTFNHIQQITELVSSGKINTIHRITLKGRFLRGHEIIENIILSSVFGRKFSHSVL